SDTTVRRDLRKAGIYAAGGVPCYWRLDLASRRLEVYSGPRADGSWALVRSLGEDEQVELPGLDVRWRVGELLPAP
ncbi:MAG TPA: Uma2 family endonuclease, partial [Kofleriaceae bacterium]|nr:Uma2 family endonuclease [Kofleriaceae bacterium]